ncbi:nitrite reductase (NAD(P)H) small subunit [Streptomyces sp. NPDC058659]|uniref:nitrite reductase (NAD(P)H) small subunit n=1 Tax=unclassified Streptomyces TaxID=2593676 RepID=UPI00365C5B7E
MRPSTAERPALPEIWHAVRGGRRRTGRVVASPPHQQEFDLRTGAYLDDPEVSLPVLPVPPTPR